MEAKEMFFQKDSLGRIISIYTADAAIKINWEIKDFDSFSAEEKEFTINTANFIVEVACSCRGIQIPRKQVSE